MNYIKSRDEVLKEVKDRVYLTISYNMTNVHNQSMSNIGYTIQNAIADGITEGIKVLMENTYTDQQFEQDIKLRT
jgi:hypothetical protein